MLRARRAVVATLSACSIVVVSACGGGERSAGADATTAAGSSAAVPAGREVVLVDLGSAGAVAGWSTVNDPVMGGRSSSRVAFGDGGLVFSGDVSLQNNGGFASTRSPRDIGIGQRAAGATALRVRAVGDGKTYVLKVGVAGQPWSYIERFPTEAGVERTYDLPVAGFEPVGTRFDPAPEAPWTLKPSSIDEVAVYILDKQQGPFTITVSAINAVS